MCQARICGRVLARVQVLQNSGSRIFVLRFTTLSARDWHWRNPRKKNYRERNNIKSARVSALTGSMPRKMAEVLKSVSALIRNGTQVAKLNASIMLLTLTTKPLLEKKGIWLVVFRHLQPILLRTWLSFSDCSSWISRPDKKFQNSWTQTFDRYILSHST